jgi:cardiolipin synthase
LQRVADKAQALPDKATNRSPAAAMTPESSPRARPTRPPERKFTLHVQAEPPHPARDPRRWAAAVRDYLARWTPAQAAPAPAPRIDTQGALAQHAAALEATLGAPLAAGNRIELLVDGPATYRAMFEAIDAARDHINIESYTIEAEGPGQELARRLIQKRRQGVKVNLLFDHVGSLGTGSRFFDALREAGVQMCCYNPLVRGWKAALGRSLHWRDHRKLLVVDGKVAFTGSLNICSASSRPAHGTHRRWLLRQTPWRDTHVRIEGPVVAQLQQLFLDHWVAQTGQRPYLSHFFPRLQPVGGLRTAVAAAEGGRRRNPFYRALLRAIDGAQDRVCITAAYFVPPRRLLRALVRAAQRGVAVKLVLPGLSDSWAALHAGRSHYTRLLKAGVRIFERQHALLHAKTAVIDGVWATVGSHNLDWRSMLHNAEANVVALDERFAGELETVFADDLRHSTEVTLPEWRGRGRLQRLREAVARRFEFLL